MSLPGADLPHDLENALHAVNGFSRHPGSGILPVAEALLPVKIFIGQIDAAGIADFSVDQNIFLVGAEIEGRIREDSPDQGSCIMILGTDLPVTSRQLGRIIRRCSVGMARLGSYIGHGSGEVMVGFSTANRIPTEGGCLNFRCIHESHMDDAFRAAAEATEEAVLRSMLEAGTVTGYTGKVRRSLREFWP